MKLSTLRSIGEKREKDFLKLGVNGVEDLVRFYPRAYLDLTERASLKTAYLHGILKAWMATRTNKIIRTTATKTTIKQLRKS